MRVIRKQDLIQSAAARYAATYQRRGVWPQDRDYTEEQRIHAALSNLAQGADEAEVTALIGHNRFTRNACHQCGLDSAVTVAFGHETHHMLDTLPICPSCLDNAVVLATSA